MLDDIKVQIKYKLSGLWCSVMLCYIYGDYFELYQPGKLQAMLSGRTALGPARQTALLGMAALMAIPSLMVALSLLLPAALSRWLNIVFGILYSAIMVLAIQGSWHFYEFFGFIEIALTLTIVWQAWTWPERPTRS